MSGGDLGLKKLAYEFIVANRAGALATADKNGIPHVAPVFCIADENLNIYFSTRVEGRKYLNLTNQKLVALAFTNEENLQAIQLSGEAERIDNLELEQEILHKLMTLRHADTNWPMPTMQLFERGATNELAIIKITPSEMTYANFETSRSDKSSSFFHTVI